jgi:hypothetical protein
MHALKSCAWMMLTQYSVKPSAGGVNKTQLTCRRLTWLAVHTHQVLLAPGLQEESTNAAFTTAPKQSAGRPHNHLNELSVILKGGVPVAVKPKAHASHLTITRN